MTNEENNKKKPEIIRVDIETPNKVFNPIEFPVSGFRNAEIVTTSFGKLGVTVPYEQRVKATKVIEIARSSKPFIQYVEFGLNLESEVRFRITIAPKEADSITTANKTV